MKPIYVIFRAFGPYVKEQKIDFEKLEKTGLFLICGETGSGKTTILDAITYSLYGQSSGGGRGSIESMRCNLAPDEVDTYIEYVFESAGKRYKFVRQIKKGRKNFNTSQKSLIENKDGVFEAINENQTATKVNADAERIIGLSYDQFRQVIILPQGQFEKLLTADSSEKEKILVSIFKAEKWQEISEIVYRKAKAQADIWHDEKNAIDNVLKEFECDNLLELSELVDRLQDDKKQQELIFHDIKEKKDTTEKKLTQMSLTKHQFEQWDQCCADLEGQKDKIPLIEEWEKSLKDNERAEKVSAQLDSFSKAEKEFAARDKSKNGAEAELKKAEEDFKRECEKQQKHQDKKQENEQRKIDAAMLNEAREVYANLDELTANIQKQQTLLDRAKESLTHNEEIRDGYNHALVVMQDEQQLILQKHQEMYRAYTAGISGKLAKNLVDGEPCPVCGSVHHPKKAVICGDEITDEMLKNVENQEKEIQKKIDAKRSDIDKASEDVETARQIYEKNNREMAQMQTGYEIACSKRIDGMASLEQVDERIRKENEAVKAYENEEQLLQKSLQQANDRLVGAKEALSRAALELKNAMNAKETAQEQLNEAMRAESIPSLDWLSAHRISQEEKAKLQSDIAAEIAATKQLTAQEKKYREQLEQTSRPDMTEINDEYKQITERYENCLRDNTLLDERLKMTAKRYKELKTRVNKFEMQFQQAEDNLSFARQLRGDTGVGLQRYVLGVMLSAITSEANELLKNVHGGRYQLYRTDSVSGHTKKAGLELEVHDANANMESRGVRGLSGGEKFLVALSLSIGLSTVAQKQGMKLEAMFIDEGFGSLDQNSIGDALDVLGSIRRTNGLVGIISHVQVLRDNIPTQIRIKKDRDGSTCSL